ncbi:protein of unknown function DUF124 [Thermaerobacter marianensis DSM 12885]|uniref:TIGR00266 family protein n=1 Tax=Thermaerobacter marianensis (strain ATCC 700841 / DSM 12885 / JCM 10246 / 7p75a) TaxID=644966 RepID=E6SG51_THEM7|nr:AIM24 family protein [Thermaerobacter marianensis]ADU50468.1 protein of unknown function DUF124 [Thermaerobacter marianensis DSM 12885]
MAFGENGGKRPERAFSNFKTSGGWRYRPRWVRFLHAPAKRYRGYTLSGCGRFTSSWHRPLRHANCNRGPAPVRRGSGHPAEDSPERSPTCRYGGGTGRDDGYLKPGERYVVDTGHVVAFSDGMGFQVRRAGTGWFSSIASGEGLACEFTGPGTVYIQTRSEASFLGWLIPKLPAKRD